MFSMRRTLVAALLVAVPLAAGSPAAAAPGTGEGAKANCYAGSRIIVSAPTLQPEFPVGHGGYVGNGWVVNNLSQDVAYRAHLYRWNGSTWAFQTSGPWLRQRVTSNPGGLGGTAWIDTSIGQAVQGPTTFTLRVRGYFRVATEYRWYPVAGTSYTGGSLPRSWVSHYDLRTNAYSLGEQKWCAY